MDAHLVHNTRFPWLPVWVSPETLFVATAQSIGCFFAPRHAPQFYARRYRWQTPEQPTARN